MTVAEYIEVIDAELVDASRERAQVLSQLFDVELEWCPAGVRITRAQWRRLSATEQAVGAELCAQFNYLDAYIRDWEAKIRAINEPPRERARAVHRVQREAKAPPPRQHWADQFTVRRELPVDVALPVPVTETDEPDEDGDHLLADDVDRRARAYQSWAPWQRRLRSRRYEGFSERCR